MSKSIPSLLLALVLITGCGGGSSDEIDKTNTPSTSPSSSVQSGKGKTTGQYKLWEYVTPKTDTTNSFIETTGDTTQSYKTTYSISTNSVTETADYVANEKTIYTKKEDRITVSFTKDGTPNGSYDLDLTADINDIVTVKDSTCKLTKHYDSVKINDKTFSDVIEIKCNDKPGYYQKGVGEVAQTQLIGTSGARSVRILSN
ncbi:MAG TPA: hypothetical protein EYH01_00275 [Campylobacterales bacterium]|nr:hypothetical protein [Campylobacterales bacterium]